MFESYNHVFLLYLHWFVAMQVLAHFIMLKFISYLTVPVISEVHTHEKEDIEIIVMYDTVQTREFL